MKIPDLAHGGYFIEHSKIDGVSPRYAKNTLVQFGANAFLRDIFRKETTLLPDIYYLGLTNASYTFDGTTLAGLHAGEPVGNGYARQAIDRNTTDWTVQEVNGVEQVLSKICTFVASADWTQTWLRMFLCDASAGTVGNVISLSGPAPAARTVLNGNGPEIQYTYFMRG